MTPDPPADERSRPPAAASDGATDEQSAEPDGGEPAVEEPSPGGEGGEPAAARQTGRPEYVQSAEEFDWRGWLLVGLVFVCFLVLPGVILVLPQASGFIASLGFSLRQAYLVLPMIPAIALGLTAVWAALRSQRTRED